MEMFFNVNFQLYLTSYLLGAIPFGWVFVKILTKKDIRGVGSGGSGATNVYRALKEAGVASAKKYAIATAVLDGTKVAILLFIAKLSGIQDSVLWAMAFFGVVGHCYSVYLLFDGGKGVATAFGALIVLIPFEALIGFVVWFLVAKYSKISSLSSLSGLLAVVISSFLISSNLGDIGSQVPLLLIAFIVVYKHIPNIIRLLKGEEKKLAL